MAIHRRRTRWSIIILWMSLLHYGCSADQQNDAEPSGVSTGETDFPDIGVGCSAIRLSADEWSITCDSPSAENQDTRAEGTSSNMKDGGVMDPPEGQREDSDDQAEDVVEETSVDAGPISTVAETDVQDMALSAVLDATVPPTEPSQSRDATPQADMGAIEDAMPAMNVVADADLNHNLDMGLNDAVEPPPPGPVRCDPPLSLSTTRQAVYPNELARLRAAGGTGAWRFSFETNRSGGLLNGTTGAYLAGTETRVLDTFILTDEACEGEARAHLRVVPPMEVLPAEPDVERNQSLTFQPLYGSGAFQLELVDNRSGASIQGPMQYRAGVNLGIDTLRLTDVETNYSVLVKVTVVESVTLNASPRVIYVPVNAKAEIGVTGGSGVYAYEADADILFEDGLMIGATPGQFSITIRDQFGPRSTQVDVVVVESLKMEPKIINDHTQLGKLIAVDDLNQDGVRDFIVTEPENDTGSANGGLVAVYHSTDGQFEGGPVQVFTGAERDDELGRGVAVGDINGDGLSDLLYGIFRSDVNGANSGAMYMHLGQPDGRFSEAPDQVFDGPQNDGYYGSAIAICDFNGDERMDLAVASWGYEDRDWRPRSYNHGAVMVHLGYPDGFLPQPDQIIVGREPDDDGNWVPWQNLFMGSSLAAGDFDGDGLCDLAANSVSWARRANGGAVYVFRGRAPADLSPGGLTEMPAWWFRPDEANDQNGQFGRRLAAGDVNGDQVDDLVVGHFAADSPGPNTGSIHLFLGRNSLGSQPGERIWAHEADWTAHGEAHDHFGLDVHVADIDGEPPLDIMTTAIYGDDRDNGHWDAGRIIAFSGVQDALPSHEPLWSLFGPEQSYQLGLAALPLGDLNDDGLSDYVALSNRGGTEQRFVGGLFLIQTRAEEPATSTRLDIPRSAAGSRFGTGVALVGDVDGDGFGDAIVSAPFSAHPNLTIRSGELWFYRGGADGFSSEGERVESWAQLTDWDLMRNVEFIGDFNGDGHDDFAVVLPNDDRTNDLSEEFIVGENCTPRLNDQGGVYIFLGGPDDFDFKPDFVYWGAHAGDVPEAITGGFDFNGDQLADLALGIYRRDPNDLSNAGAVTLITGRQDSEPGKVKVICDASFEHTGHIVDMQLGFTVAAVKDLDGDGCDELAVGARLSSQDEGRNRGELQLIYGFGGAGCPAEARFSRFGPPNDWIQAGNAIAAADVDGDGLDDVAIGAPYYARDGANRGAVWLLTGQFLTAVAPMAWADALNEVPRWPADEAGMLLSGRTANGEFGRGLIATDGLIGVATMNDYLAETSGVASVHFYGLKTDGTLDPAPRAVFFGETNRPGSRLGEHESMGLSPDGTHAIIGAAHGGGTARDNGSAYILELNVIPNERTP